MRGQGHLLPLGNLIGSFYLHANHSGGNRERAGLIMPNVWLIRNAGAPEGWNYPDSIGVGGQDDCMVGLGCLLGQAVENEKMEGGYYGKH